MVPATTSPVTFVDRRSAPPPDAMGVRPRVRGKFIVVGDAIFYIRGVTYGTFRPGEDGRGYPGPDVVERDFTRIAANGLNAIRTYTVPPRWLLDAAQRHGLRVMVGLAWEQHVTFLDDENHARSIERRVGAGVRACAGHPAVLCYAIGNEIPAPIVRWHGRRRVERYLERLYLAAKAEDPDGLVTYVNYPTTEYLQLPFVDIAGFNVYLESQERLDAYLTRLHNLVGDRPLIMAEVGLDSRRHGEETQARVLDWQIRTSFAAGCAGVVVFAWTDEWYRGGYEIDDWDFGLTRRDRGPKPALLAVRDAFGDVPFPKHLPWPRISVVVCTYNGAATIRDCFEGLLRLEYPNFEVIVVNDGSRDATPAIAQEYRFRLISTENRGLSSARNTGMEAASGEIVAYIDDDARPDPQWLTYLAAPFLTTSHVGVGGPNVAPPGDGEVADCVAHAPGGPSHVLLSDREAEHIPGCNMAFRKVALQAIGGFDPQFRVAGDDVDVCWRLQQRGWTLGFSPAAVVWHHRRKSVKAYWRQQRGYGQAEALLERKWPDKYSAAGHVAWAGRIYGLGIRTAIGSWRARIYHGTWGSAPFQSLYQPSPGTLSSLLLVPEWYLIIAVLAAVSSLGALWNPLLFTLPLLAIAAVAPVAHAAASAARVSLADGRRSRLARLRSRVLIGFLYLLQPTARLLGRLRHGLTPWRRRGHGLSPPWPWTSTIWREQGQASPVTLKLMEAILLADGVPVRRGGGFDRWDLELRGGLFGAARAHLVIEEHGAGRQLVRLRSWPCCVPGGVVLAGLLAVLAGAAGLRGAGAACSILGVMGAALAFRMAFECGSAMAPLRHTLRALERHQPGDGR